MQGIETFWRAYPAAASAAKYIWSAIARDLLWEQCAVVRPGTTLLLLKTCFQQFVSSKIVDGRGLEGSIWLLTVLVMPVVCAGMLKSEVSVSQYRKSDWLRIFNDVNEALIHFWIREFTKNGTLLSA